MNFDLILIISTSCLFGNCICTLSAGQLYSMHGEYLTAGTVLDHYLPAKSKSQCAILCFRDEHCATFHYNDSSKRCYCSEGLVPIGVRNGPHVAKGVCPQERGYSLYLKGKNLLCLKYYSYTQTPNLAKLRCTDDGGHLILIENESMIQFVYDIMDKWAVDEVLIDGYDEDNDGNYMTYRGDPLPYVPPGSDLQDTAIELCVRMIREKWFQDLPCDTGGRDFICQIEV